MTEPIPPMPPPPPEESSRRSSRLWLLLPAGCLGVFVLLGFLVFAGIAFVMNTLRSSDVYADALAAAEANPAVVEALGEPIKGGFLISGDIHYHGGSGEASLAIPISGPEGGATIYADAIMTEGDWAFTQLVVRIGETGERIDLLEKWGQ